MSVLLEAHEIIHGDRQKDYGHPGDSFAAIAHLWEAYLNRGTKQDGCFIPINPKDVAHMMILLKLARLVYNPDHQDSYTDICGYAEIGSEL